MHAPGSSFFKKLQANCLQLYEKKRLQHGNFSYEFFKNTYLVEHLTNSCFWREINEETQTFIWLKCFWSFTSFPRGLVPLELVFCVLGIIFIDFFQGEKNVTFKF